MFSATGLHLDLTTSLLWYRQLMCNHTWWELTTGENATSTGLSEILEDGVSISLNTAGCKTEFETFVVETIIESSYKIENKRFINAHNLKWMFIGILTVI